MCLAWADLALYSLIPQLLCYLQFLPATWFCSILASSSFPSSLLPFLVLFPFFSSQHCTRAVTSHPHCPGKALPEDSPVTQQRCLLFSLQVITDMAR